MKYASGRDVMVGDKVVGLNMSGHPVAGMVVEVRGSLMGGGREQHAMIAPVENLVAVADGKLFPIDEAPFAPSPVNTKGPG